MSKRTRQQTILEIISKRKIPSQASLAEELKALGFDVTQATLSRDISDLNLVKSKDGYTRQKDTSTTGIGMGASDAEGTIKRNVLKVEDAGNLIVIKTTVGAAQSVAVAIDEGNWGPILGTIAGDDTILVIAKAANQATDFKQKLDELLK